MTETRFYQKVTPVPEDVLSQSTFVKAGATPRIEIEAEKTEKARSIGLENGFTVPRVFELRGERLALERLAGLQPIASLSGSSRRIENVHARLGRCLRAVHEELRLEERIPLPDPLKGMDEVFLHGDFSTENVCVRGEEIVIIDWQMTAIHGGTATFGSRYFDVSWFINNLFSRVSPNVLDASRRAQAFLAGYFESPSTDCSIERFWEYHSRFRRYKLDLRKTLPLPRKLVMAPGNLLWQRFAPKRN